MKYREIGLFPPAGPARLARPALRLPAPGTPGLASSRLRRARLRPDLVEVVNDLMALWDFALIPLSAYACATVYSELVPRDIVTDFLSGPCGGLALIGALLGPVLLHNSRIATLKNPGSQSEVVRFISVDVAILLGLLLAIGFLTQSTIVVPRTWMTMWFTTIYVSTLATRLLLIQRVRALERCGLLRETVAIIGVGPLAERWAERLSEPGQRRFDIVGIFDHRRRRTSFGCAPPNGTLDDLIERGKIERLDWLLLAVPQASAAMLCSIARKLKGIDAVIAVCPDAAVLNLPSRTVEWFGDMPLIAVATRPLRPWGRVLKSIEDKALGALLLLFAVPLGLLVALAIKLDSPGPIFFSQRRHGWNNSEFNTFKFRTMTWAPAEQAGVFQQTARNDSRVTRVGRVLRKTSIDELPQLFNVLRGDMSLVGPRPHPVEMRTENRLGAEITAEYAHRHRMKPGITGWAQVNGYRGATATAAAVRKRIEYDIQYIDNWSILFDLRILMLTPLSIVFNQRNAF